MNEGEFPRPAGDAGLNRILSQPRRGDRDTRSEDRYLFLEALMSARDVLHISFVGEGVRDGKPRNPAAPLAELLQFLDEQHAIGDDASAARPWLVRHPLQPFDARYYERDAYGQPLHDARLFSYDAAFLATPGAAADPRFLADSELADSLDAGAEGTSGEVSLAALKRYWRDPARDALQRGHGISLQALDGPGWPDREPLETGFERIERVDRRLLFDSLQAGHARLPEAPPAWLAHSGMLAAGAIGESAYSELRDGLQSLLDSTRPLFADGCAQATAQAVELDLGDGVRLSGVVDRLYRGADGRRLLFDAKPAGAAGLRELLAFYIDWAALRLTAGDGVQADYLEHPPTIRAARRPRLIDALLAQDTEQLRHGLRALIDMYLAGQQQPLLFFPQSALAYASSAPDERLDKAAAAWAGDGFGQVGERDYAPGYAALLSRGLDLFDPSSAAHRAFVAATGRVCAVLDPQHAMLFEPAPSGTDAAPEAAALAARKIGRHTSTPGKPDA